MRPIQPVFGLDFKWKAIGCFLAFRNGLQYATFLSVFSPAKGKGGGEQI